MLIRKLLRTAWNYRSQFISMIIMTAIGIGVFLGFNIEWHSIESDTDSFFKNTNYADYRVYSECGFSSDTVDKIQKNNGIKAATRYLFVNVGIKDTDKTVNLNVSESYNVSTMLITQGVEYNENLKGIWLSDRFAETNNISIGDDITLLYQGIEITGEIIGLCKSSENMICVADSNQLMPDYKTHGFAYITPTMLEESLGTAFYPQLNIISDMKKDDIEKELNNITGKTLQIVDKDLHTSYAGAKSESEEGKAMGSVLPVLFLAIAILTMVTTMHRIATNEKIQIGILKALGFRNSRILIHYTSYGFVIGAIGSIIGIALGYLISSFIMSPTGMMSTYFDLPEWNLTMPSFCIPVVILTVAFLTFISFLSTKKMLLGTASESLKPYTPKPIKRATFERFSFWDTLPFHIKWNIRDISRHKSRSAMTLLGVFGCMLLIVGGLGMKDTMYNFLSMLDDTMKYSTKINIAETANNEDIYSLCKELTGDWQSSSGVDYNGKTISLDIYNENNDKVRILNERNEIISLDNDGVYLCLRLKNTANINDIIEISPYGSEKTYRVKVIGYFRSLMNECIAMTDSYADSLEIDYHISSIYTDVRSNEIKESGIISGKQDKDSLMSSYDSFLELMNLMVIILIVAAVILEIVVLYSLGVMSYVERRREIATLKVLGFRNKYIRNLLMHQNTWLTIIGILIGLPGGAEVLRIIITVLASEYELSITLGKMTYAVSILITFIVSLLVSFTAVHKSKKIDMTEALKDNE